MPAARFTTTRVMERIASVGSDWSVETQSSAMFVGPSPPSTRPLDRSGGEGLAARLDCSLYRDLIITLEEHMAIVAIKLSYTNSLHVSHGSS